VTRWPGLSARSWMPRGPARRGILLVSLAATGVLAYVAHHLPEQHQAVRSALALGSVLTGLLIGALFFYALFRPVAPRHVLAAGLWSGALVGAALFEVLKQLSGRLLASTAGAPAIQAFGISMILLVWIYYFSRVVMFAAAWAATADPRRLGAAR